MLWDLVDSTWLPLGLILHLFFGSVLRGGVEMYCEEGMISLFTGSDMWQATAK